MVILFYKIGSPKLVCRELAVAQHLYVCVVFHSLVMVHDNFRSSKVDKLLLESAS